MDLTRIVFGFFFLSLLMPQSIMAQDTIKKAKKQQIQKQEDKKISTVADELKESLTGNDEILIAKKYENLAQAFIDKGENAKAEDYLKKALDIYIKHDKTFDIARIRRSIAKVQESQNKINAALRNYKEAEITTDDKTFERLNSNDYNRLKNSSNSAVQQEYNNDNLKLLDKSNGNSISGKTASEETADAYIQKAELDFKQKNKDVAIKSYEKALTYFVSKPKEVIKIKNEIAKVYASDNQFDKAIEIHQKLLDEAVKTQDFDTQIVQRQLLSSLYFKKNQPETGIDILKEAYSTAAKNGRTTEAKKCLSQLLQYYKSKGDEKQSMLLYEQFFQNFDQLIRADSTLIDAKTFQITEEKIRQLEKEKKLKDELISKKNTFNYFLIGSVFLLLLFFVLIAKALYSIKIKNKKIALQSLRREMNPHFIFNSLNSVNQFISQNNERQANKYLTSYSNLMRNMMENSNKDFVTLGNEIEQLNKYLGLEHLRFPEQFDYKIDVDENLDTETTFIPNMIIQPHLENAIWHGLRYKEGKGLLVLSFKLETGKVMVTIDDNGIGLTKSNELKTKNQKVHQSRGITNTKERIGLLNELYKKEISFQITEKQLPETGTLVALFFPLINKI